MRNKIYRQFGWLAALLLLAASKATGASVALTVSPPLVEMVLAPGSDRNLEISVTNDGDKPLSVKAEVLGLELSRTGSPIPLPAGKGIWSAVPWVSVSQGEFTLQAHEVKEVRCRIRIPRGETGGRQGVLLFTTRPAGELSTGSLNFETRTGTVLLLAASRTGRLQAEVTGMRALCQESGDIAFEAELRNNGNVHLKAAGEVVLRDINNRIVARLPMSGGTGTVLPDGVRVYQAVWNARRVRPGAYGAEVRYNAAGLRPLIVTYTLRVGDDGKTVTVDLPAPVDSGSRNERL